MIMSDADFRNTPSPKWIIEGVLSDGDNAMLLGREASYKSFIAGSMAFSIADPNESTWMGFPIHQHGTVLYVAAEAPSVMKDRAQMWSSDPIDMLYWENEAVDLSEPLAAEFWQFVKERNVMMVVFDTLQLCGGTSERFKRTLENFEMLRALNTVALLVHHPMKHEPEKPYGPSPLFNTNDTRYLVQKPLNGDTAKVTNVKNRRGQPFDPFGVTIRDGIPVRVESAPLVVEEVQQSRWGS